MLQRLTAYRRVLHRIPELSDNLPKTRGFCLETLESTKAVLEPVLESGLLAYFDAGKPETIAFRTDMDALPIQEKTGVGFCSRRPGVMHACGHDGHMAMMLVFAEELSKLSDLPYNVLLIFQPAEENGGGGGRIVRSGKLDAYGISRIYALHVAPEYPAGTLSSRPGAMMATSSEIFVTARGKAAHAAKACDGVDALMALAAYYLRGVEAIGRLDPSEPRLLHFGEMHGGTAPNIVCDEANLHGTMRAFSSSFFSGMKTVLLQTGKDVSAETGAEIGVRWDEGYPPLINDPEVYRRARAELSDFRFVEMEQPSLLTEDFAFYLERFPGLMLKLGVGCGIPLHSDSFNFDEAALETGVKAMLRLCGC